ncbi:MAG: hypothetical protein A2V70_05420, partial [Planctomycetes bacterium RBG_13_63_9]
MSSCCAEIFRRHFRPLAPIATGETPVLQRIPGIRSVLFDLYGTLLISDSGEVGAARQPAADPNAAPQRALAEALHALGIPGDGLAAQGTQYLFRAIEASHARSREAAVEFPEVDIIEIWRTVLVELTREGLVKQAVADAIDLRRLATEYEARTNPCWPMPNLRKCLAELRGDGLLLGIISNAQFYTPDLFEALLDEPIQHWGFQPDLQYYSYQHGLAKPGLELFALAAEALRRRRIGAHEVLYVGNDMLNDVFPAQKIGFHTALFAGDARSLRRRGTDQR